jgi:hypothetical protein
MAVGQFDFTPRFHHPVYPPRTQFNPTQYLGTSLVLSALLFIGGGGGAGFGFVDLEGGGGGGGLFPIPVTFDPSFPPMLQLVVRESSLPMGEST